MDQNPYAGTEVPLDPSVPVGEEGEVSDAVVEELSRTKPWILTMGIIACFYAAMMVIAAAGMALMPTPNDADFPIGAMAIFYLLFAIVMAMPGVLLFKYFARISDLKIKRSTSSLVEALRSQRIFWFVCVMIVAGSIVVGILFAIGMAVFVFSKTS